MSVSAIYFFDSKNGSQPLGVRQAAPAYPQVYGKNIGKSIECSNLNHLAVIQPGEGAKHSLKVLLYNDMKR